MEKDCDQSPDTMLQGCTGTLVAVVKQSQHRKCLATFNWLSTSAPLILVKSGPYQGQRSLFELTIPYKIGGSYNQLQVVLIMLILKTKCSYTHWWCLGFGSVL